MTDPDYSQSMAFLLSQIGAHAARRFAVLVRETGLNPRAFGVMSNIAHLGPRNQQTLADELGLHRNNMVSVIDELESSGWVRRVRSEQDRRSFTIELTALGQSLTDQALRLIPVLDAELSQQLTPSDVRSLTQALNTIATVAGLSAGVHPHLASRRNDAD